MVDAVEAFDRAFLLAARLSEMMTEALSERGLTTARAEVIFVLQQMGPVVQRQLSEALRRSPRQITALVDGLEATGFVRRGAHPTDRRATLVELTGEGRKAAKRMLRERAAAADRLLGGVSESRLAGFVSTVDLVVSGLEQGRVRQ